MISVQILCDSINSITGKRITTFELVYPRFIHAQVLTHRVFSRNSRSSRAVPFHKMLSDARGMPVRPVYYGKNQKGMSAAEELDDSQQTQIDDILSQVEEFVFHAASQLAAIGLHKQHVNRIIEPFTHIETILTGTDFDNFFELRLSHDAQPEIQELAAQMKAKLLSNTPQILDIGQWHIPYIELTAHSFDVALAVSTARCARVSYRSFSTGATSSIEEDVQLYGRLFRDKHLSPFEHQAMANIGRHANLVDWISQRTLIETYQYKNSLI